MTAVKAKSESRVVLDFSTINKCSKNHIKQALRGCEVVCVEESKEPNEFTIFRNEIKIGMYTVVLELPFDSPLTWRHLRDYGDFQVSIYDSSHIDLKLDNRFKSQYWVLENFFGKLRIKHLVDIISHCARLDKLKSFI
jgi:hypothetical protein